MCLPCGGPPARHVGLRNPHHSMGQGERSILGPGPAADVAGEAETDADRGETEGIGGEEAHPRSAPPRIEALPTSGRPKEEVRLSEV